MALRVTSGPALSTRSGAVGQPIAVSMKVENSSPAEEAISLHVEELKEGALGRPLAHPFVFDPPSAAVPPKARRALTFTWTATLPPGKEPAFTYRGKLVVRASRTGQLVASAPLDLYVREG
jgi:P pilus assembly chaperone PapD